MKVFRGNCFDSNQGWRSLGVFILFVLSFFSLNAQQTDSVSTELNASFKSEKLAEKKIRKPFAYNYHAFTQLIPNRDNITVGYRTRIVGREYPICDIHPNITLMLYNDYKEKMEQEEKKFAQSYSIVFRSQFRLYNKFSTPIRMPSYKIMFTLQHLYKFSNRHLFTYSIETGHYSNGQDGSPIRGGGMDGSRRGDSLFAAAILNPDTDFSKIINRENGDFSTNVSELLVNYKFIPEVYRNTSKPIQIHSFTMGAQNYHNLFLGLADIGGYRPLAIRLYGKWRYLFSYSYTYNFKKGYRIFLNENLEIISKPHPSVNKVRSVTQATFYFPFALGFFVSYNYGHDDYNLRMVDSGHQLGVGFMWDLFPAYALGKRN